MSLSVSTMPATSRSWLSSRAADSLMIASWPQRLTSTQGDIEARRQVVLELLRGRQRHRLAAALVDRSHDLRHRPVAGLVERIAGQALGGAVEIVDAPAGVDEDDRVGDRVQGHQRALLGLEQHPADAALIALGEAGDVGDADDHARRDRPVAAERRQLHQQVAAGRIARREAEARPVDQDRAQGLRASSRRRAG